MKTSQLLDVTVMQKTANHSAFVSSSTSKLGLGSLLGFVASQAVRDVYLGHLFGALGLYEVATLAFGTAALMFGTILMIFRRHQIALLLANWRTVFVLNLTTAIAWLSYFQALRMVEPVAANLAFCGVAPIAVAAIGSLGLTNTGEQKSSGVEKGLHWALLGTVVLLAVIVGTRLSGFQGLHPTVGLVGVALAAFAGVSITAESMFAKRMNNIGVSAISVVGVRFLLVTLIAASMMLQIDMPYEGMSPVAIAGQAGIFLLILIGPIYLAQAGIALTTPLVSGVICAVGPIATLALQSTAGNIILSPAILAVTIIYAALSTTAAWLSASRSHRLN